MRVGILALQGGFEAHAEACVGQEVFFLKESHDLLTCDKLILPGGESTCWTKLFLRGSWYEPLLRYEKPILATCAGAIMLCDSLIDGDGVVPVKKMPVTAQRNAYGSQNDSFRYKIDLLGLKAVDAYFIRAPRFVKIGNDVEVLAMHNADPVAISYRNITALTCHPELSETDHRFHQWWLAQ